MQSIVSGEWTGWDGATVVELDNGTKWAQDEYVYDYHYSYRPKVTIDGGKMLVEGMPRAVRVRQIF